MIGRRLNERLRSHGWFAVGVDLAVVITGILLALQVDGCAQRRDDRRLETVYLQRLKEDLEIERARMVDAEHYANQRIEAARLLSRIVDQPTVAVTPPGRIAWAIETASWRSFPRINAFVYGELQNSGRLVVLRSVRLRRSLAEHYTALQHDARVGEDLSAQHRFDAATAGILSVDELAAIENAGGSSRIIDLTSERAAVVAKAFAQRPTAVAELPSLVQHHTFNLRVIRQMKERADDIIRHLDELLARHRQ